MATKKVIDLSKWNTVSDYLKASNNVDGVILRCGYRGLSTGVINEDNLFDTHVEGFIKNKTPLGVYFFSTAITTTEAITEADFAIKMVKEKGFTPAFPIAIDTEFCNSTHTGRSDTLDKATRTAVVKAFLDRVKSKGYEGMIYCSDSWLTYNIDSTILSGYKKWIARYGGKKPSISTNLVGWQYGTTTIEGIPSVVDTNEWYGEIIVPTTEITTGMKITLNKTNLYSTSTTTKVATTKTGTFYVWSAAKRNNRVRITNKLSNVGVAGAITGWINVSDI